MIIFELPVVLKLVAFALLVMTVTPCLQAVLMATFPVLCHRKPCTEEGKYRRYQNNLCNFHGHLLSVEICSLGRK